ncbi:MAG: pitrilysin family protein [bacterium]
MNIKHIKLKNNAQLIIFKNKKLKSITASIVFNVGTKNENNKTYGISHFIEHLICQNKTLNKKLDFLGTKIIGYTYKETTSYLLRTIKKDFEYGFNFFIKSLMNIDISNNEIIKERKIISKEIEISQNDYFILVDDMLENLMYHNSYISQTVLGSISSIKKINKKKVKTYYQKYYNPNNLVICIIGDINTTTENKIIKSINKQNSKINLPVPKFRKNVLGKTKKTKTRLAVKKNRQQQIEVAIGLKGFDFFDKKKYILRLLSIILTNGYNSRLFKKIREEKGLAYYLDSFCVEYIKNGYLEIKFTTTKNTLQQILSTIYEELKRLKTQKINDKELTRAKRIFKNDTILNLENPIILSEYLAEEKTLTGKNIDIEKELFKFIDKINAKDILKITSKVFSKKNIYISLIGDVPIKIKKEFFL